MRKYAILLLLIGLLFGSLFWPRHGRSSANLSYVKDAVPTATATCGSFTASFTPTNAGDSWVLLVGAGGSSSDPFPILVSDNNGGSWTLQGLVSGANGIISVFTSPNHLGGATTLTITDNAGSGTCGQVALMYEFSGLFAPLLDQVAVNTSAGASTTWSAGTTGNLLNPSEVAIAGFLALSASSTVASASGPTNSYTQASSGVTQDSGKEIALGSSYLLTGNEATQSTQLTASASVANSVSILITFAIGPMPAPLCSPGFLAVGFGCSSGLGQPCGTETCDAKQNCFFGPAASGASPTPICLAQCTLINSFSNPQLIYVNGCSSLGPCPCTSVVTPTATPTQVSPTPTPTFTTATATPTFTAVPTLTPIPPTVTKTATPFVPPPTPVPTPTSTPGGNNAMPAALINCFSKVKWCNGCFSPGVISITCFPTACFQSVAGLTPNGDLTAIYNCQQPPNGSTAFGPCLATFWDKTGGPSACNNCTPRNYSTDPNDYVGSPGYNASLTCP